MTFGAFVRNSFVLFLVTTSVVLSTNLVRSFLLIICLHLRVFVFLFVGETFESLVTHSEFEV